MSKNEKRNEETLGFLRGFNLNKYNSVQPAHNNILFTLGYSIR